jgi:hypothetical protein
MLACVMQRPTKWLLLLYSLPTRRSAERVSLWRQLKRLSAIPLKTSAYLLPDTPSHFERFQWLAQQVRQGRGDATVIRVTEVEGLTHEQIVQMFNDARAAEYDELIRHLTKLVERNKRKRQESLDADLDKTAGWLEEIQKTDFFGCSRAHDAQMLLQRATGLARTTVKSGPKLSAKRFTGKTWLTRPRPEIDRVASAWLIQRFIDPKARFVFSSNATKFPKALPFDMVDAEFSHHGDDCTFETLVKRFGIADKAVSKIAEMVHEADLEDGKFTYTECVGIDRVLKGWARLALSDEQLLEKGGECFDALYEFLRK